MKWKKDSGMKYTEMCMYIDEHIPQIATSSDFPEVEDTVYNYLWLIVKALAIKKCMFQSFSDYDGYAFYAARRLYFALIKNYQNQGKIIKGKLIRPVKSCLNYMKALMYPMKVEYQNETFNKVISEEMVSKQFDSFTYAEKMKDNVAAGQSSSAWTKVYLNDTFKECGQLVDKVLESAPFNKGTLDYKRLKMTILLNCLNDLNSKKMLDSKQPNLILWGLPKSMASYVRVLIKEFYMQLKLEIMDCYRATAIDDEILSKLIATPDGEYKDNED